MVFAAEAEPKRRLIGPGLCLRSGPVITKSGFGASRGPRQTGAQNGAPFEPSWEPEATPSGSLAARFSLRSTFARICHDVSVTVVGFLPLLISRSYWLLTSEPATNTRSPRRRVAAASLTRLKHTTRCQS